MIPGQGCLADILGVIALIVSWERPIPSIWWWILGLMIGGYYLSSVLKESLKTLGMMHRATIVWSVVLCIIQLAIIGLSVYVFVT